MKKLDSQKESEREAPHRKERLSVAVWASGPSDVPPLCDDAAGLPVPPAAPAAGCINPRRNLLYEYHANSPLRKYE